MTQHINRVIKILFKVQRARKLNESIDVKKELLALYDEAKQAMNDKQFKDEFLPFVKQIWSASCK